jgi:hypothetical protein
VVYMVWYSSKTWLIPDTNAVANIMALALMYPQRILNDPYFNLHIHT